MLALCRQRRGRRARAVSVPARGGARPPTLAATATAATAAAATQGRWSVTATAAATNGSSFPSVGTRVSTVTYSALIICEGGGGRAAVSPARLGWEWPTAEARFAARQGQRPVGYGVPALPPAEDVLWAFPPAVLAAHPVATTPATASPPGKAARQSRSGSRRRWHLRHPPSAAGVWAVSAAGQAHLLWSAEHVPPRRPLLGRTVTTLTEGSAPAAHGGGVRRGAPGATTLGRPVEMAVQARAGHGGLLRTSAPTCV